MVKLSLQVYYFDPLANVVLSYVSTIMFNIARAIVAFKTPVILFFCKAHRSSKIIRLKSPEHVSRLGFDISLALLIKLIIG